MWYRIADLVIRLRVPLLVLLFAFTAFMAYETTKVELSYDFTSAIPTDNPKYKDYMMFKKTFGDDGNNMMVGIQSDKLFQPEGGRLVCWNNRRPDGTCNPATLHHAMKVRKGLKYVITKWYRERPWSWDDAA